MKRKQFALMFGRHKESGIWWASTSRRKSGWKFHDMLLNTSIGRLRIRVMKPHRWTSPGRIEAAARKEWVGRQKKF